MDIAKHSVASSSSCKFDEDEYYQKINEQYKYKDKLEKIFVKYNISLDMNVFYSRSGIVQVVTHYLKNNDISLNVPQSYKKYSKMFDKLINYLLYLAKICCNIKKKVDYDQTMYIKLMKYVDLYFILENSMITYDKYKSSKTKLELFNIFDDFTVVECRKCHIICITEKKPHVKLISCNKCELIIEIEKSIYEITDYISVNSLRQKKLDDLFSEIFKDKSNEFYNMLYKKNMTNTLEKILIKHVEYQKNNSKNMPSLDKKKFIKDVYYQCIHFIKILIEVTSSMYDINALHLNTKFLAQLDILSTIDPTYVYEINEKFNILNCWKKYIYLIEKTLVDPTMSPYDILEKTNLFKNSTNTCNICSVKIFLIDMPCCKTALCGSCIEKIIAIPKRGFINLYPTCPFCRELIDINIFNIEYNKMYTKYRKDAKDPVETHYYSMCTTCPDIISTLKTCVLQEKHLPDYCYGCCYSGIKKCPTCGVNIDRIDGCNNVKCFYCKKSMCWLCGKFVNNHDKTHFIFGYFGKKCINKR